VDKNTGESKDGYVVRLWVTGVDLDPDSITNRLGLEPTSKARRGEVLHRKAVPVGSWSFNERPDDDWESLEEGLLSMTRILLPLKGELAAISTEYDVFLGCAMFKESFEGGPSFSVKLFHALAELGLPMNLSSFIPRGPDWV